MKLPKSVKDLNNIPDRFRSWYQQNGDEWVRRDELDVDDEDPSALRTKVKEMRETNIAVMKERDELKKLKEALGDVEPDQVKELLASKDKAENDELKSKGKIDELVAKRTENYEKELKRIREAAQRERDDLTEKLTRASSRLSEIAVRTKVQETFAKSGLKPVSLEAFEDAVERARKVWVLDENGEPVARRNGEPVYSAKKATEPLGLEEWASSLASTASHLFVPGQGGNGGGGEKQPAKRTPAGMRVINSKDPVAMGRYADAIADGTAIAEDPGA